MTIMSSILYILTVCVILVSDYTDSFKLTKGIKRDHSGSALQVLGNLGFRNNITDVLAYLEAALGAEFADESPLKSFDDLLSQLTEEKSLKEIFAFDGDGLNLPHDGFTKTDSNVENIDGVKVLTNASVQWSPNGGDHDDGGTLLGVIQSAALSADGKKQKECKNSSDCDKDQFCRRSFFGIPQNCHNCLNDTESCSDNDQCCGDTKLCVWNQCKEGAKMGQAGTSCKVNKDCDVGHCCALVAGYPVCKPYSSEGEVCNVVDNDHSFLDYLMGRGGFLLPSSCPCEEGLHCRSVNGAFSVLASLTGEQICLPIAGNSADEAADNIVDLLHGVFDKVKESANQKDDVVKKEDNKN